MIAFEIGKIPLKFNLFSRFQHATETNFSRSLLAPRVEATFSTKRRTLRFAFLSIFQMTSTLFQTAPSTDGLFGTGRKKAVALKTQSPDAAFESLEITGFAVQRQFDDRAVGQAQKQIIAFRVPSSGVDGAAKRPADGQAVHELAGMRMQQRERFRVVQVVGQSPDGQVTAARTERERVDAHAVVQVSFPNELFFRAIEAGRREITVRSVQLSSVGRNFQFVDRRAFVRSERVREFLLRDDWAPASRPIVDFDQVVRRRFVRPYSPAHRRCEAGCRERWRYRNLLCNRAAADHRPTQSAPSKKPEVRTWRPAVLFSGNAPPKFPRSKQSDEPAPSLWPPYRIAYKAAQHSREAAGCRYRRFADPLPSIRTRPQDEAEAAYTPTSPRVLADRSTAHASPARCSPLLRPRLLPHRYATGRYSSSGRPTRRATGAPRLFSKPESLQAAAGTPLTFSYRHNPAKRRF